MPVTFLAKRQHTISVAANDVLTILYQAWSRTSLFNLGPGNAWVVYSPSPTTPSVGNPDAIELPPNSGYEVEDWTFSPSAKQIQLLMDQASTITLTVGN